MDFRDRVIFYLRLLGFGLLTAGGAAGMFLTSLFTETLAGAVCGLVGGILVVVALMILLFMAFWVFEAKQ